MHKHKSLVLKMRKSRKRSVIPSNELFVNNHRERSYLDSAKNQKCVLCKYKLSTFNQMLVSYHRMGLEVTPGKQVTYVIIAYNELSHILFSRQRVKSLCILISITFYGKTLYFSNTNFCHFTK